MTSPDITRPDAALALRMLSLIMGVFMLFMGLDKIGWFTDGGAFLTMRLDEWRYTVRPLSQWYIERIALPGVPVFSKLVPMGELATGLALLAGVQVRAAALVALLMVLNFHVASDVLFRASYLINGYGPPVLGALLTLALAGRRLPLSVDGVRT